MESNDSASALTTIQRIATETLGVADEVLRSATTLQEAGIDSLAAIHLVFAIEAHFGITIAAQDLARVKSLQDLAGVVDRLTPRVDEAGAAGMIDLPLSGQGCIHCGMPTVVSPRVLSVCGIADTQIDGFSVECLVCKSSGPFSNSEAGATQRYQERATVKPAMAPDVARAPRAILESPDCIVDNSLRIAAEPALDGTQAIPAESVA